MNPETNEQPAGVLNLYKPARFSSAQYAYRLRRVFGLRRVGHAGTLDPFAEGVLLTCVGRATRLVERLMDLPKTYRTSLRLGVTNETFDTERPFEPVAGAAPVSPEAIESALAEMTGDVMQAPPAFSAVRVGGRFSYQLAKLGQAVEHPPRRVRIDRLTIESYAWPFLNLEIGCGRGTYIRAIARDLGAALGCGACCETLLREAVGPFRAAEAVRMETDTEASIRAALIPIPRVLDMLGAGASGRH
jgi:tRNA pseudouridine55 synthase